MTWRYAQGEGSAFAFLAFYAIGIFVLPLALLAKVAFGEGMSFVWQSLESRAVSRALWNSFESAFISALLSLIAGTATALVIGLCNVRGKSIYTFLLLIPMMIPPHITALAWIQSLGPSSPLLMTLGIAPEIGSTHPLYSRTGVIALLGIQNTPLVLLVVLAALRALPGELSESARVAGAGGCRLLSAIILPLLMPTLIAAFAMAFVSALGNFGIPALLGIPARYTTLPVLIWQRLASFGPSVLTDMAVLASLVAMLAVVAVILQLWVTSRHRNALTGPPQSPMSISLGQWRWCVEACLMLSLIATLILPVTALFATALVPTYGVALSASSITLDNFVEVLFRQAVTLRAFFNSTFLATMAASIIAILAIFASRFCVSHNNKERGFGAVFTGFADIAYAVPGLVISVAFILAFIKPLPLLNISIYNTLIIILLAYLCAFFSIALKPVIAACSQLDPSMDDAARVAGASYWLRMTRIFVPLVAPAAASGAILVFLTAYNEVTVSALLWSSGTETIGTTIFNYEDGGYTTLASAMAAVTIFATVVLMVFLDRLGRYVPPGVVPWRYGEYRPIAQDSAVSGRIQPCKN